MRTPAPFSHGREGEVGVPRGLSRTPSFKQCKSLASRHSQTVAIELDQETNFRAFSTWGADSHELPPKPLSLAPTGDLTEPP